MSEKQEIKKKIDPIVFLNAPINDENKDAIGISSSVDAIQNAIDDGAKMIGVIAEYGAGKSSLTEMLAKSDKYKDSIHINMWDSLMNPNNNDDEINSLTKSFIYQLAVGHSKRAANYVNKILNDNYGVISFSVGYQRVWWFLGIAGLLEVLYLVLNNISIYQFTQIFGKELKTLGLILLGIKPAIGMLGLVFVIAAVCYSTVAFSYWKDSSKRKTGVNEIFAAYSYVYGLLLDKEKPYIIIIDDLDRIEEKDSIIEFLKELYRFNNLYTDKKKKAPVFVISIAPETELKEKDMQKESSNGNGDTPPEEESQGKRKSEKVYSKIFDYIISLKPIHYDDYRSVISQIFKSEPDKTKRLNKILDAKDQIVDGDLPNSFTWLYKGSNLTLRELKERLNKTIGLFIDLKNKDYEGNPSISFRTCVCVTYLERTYPAEYYQILRDEENFSALIQESCVYKNDEKLRNEESINGLILKKFPELEAKKICDDLSTLILEGIIDTDYRMYFYSFPKGSYIKDIDEKDICNYLEFPKDYEYEIPSLNSKIERLESRNKISTIRDVIDRLGNTEDITYFPKVIFEHKELWEYACSINSRKGIKSLMSYLKWDGNSTTENVRIIKNVFDQKNKKNNEFWNLFKGFVFTNYAQFEEEEKIEIRKNIYCVFGKDKSLIEEFYMKEGSPFITQEEIDLIQDPSFCVWLVNVELLEESNFEIVQAMLQNKIEKSCQTQALYIQKLIVEIATLEKVTNSVFEFLYQNCLIDDVLFVKLCDFVRAGAFDKLKILAYINLFPANRFNNIYCGEINKLCITNGLKSEIIEHLIQEGLYATAMLHYEKRNALDRFIFDESCVENDILSDCELINSEYPDIIPKIRTVIVKQHSGETLEGLEQLYFGSYLIITVSELRGFKDFETGFRLLNPSKLTEENVKEYIEYINEEEHVGDECFGIFNWLFNSNYNALACKNQKIIEEIVYGLDYSKIMFSSMPEENINDVVDILETPLKLTDAGSAWLFMQKAEFLARKLEGRILQARGIDKYIELINGLNMVSDFAIETILKYQSKYPLNSAISNRLLEEKKYDYGIIGATLYNKTLFFPESELKDELLGLYNERSVIFQYYVDNERFLKGVMKYRQYRRFSPCTYGMLQPLFKLKQTSDFLNFVLDTFQSQPAQIREYLLGLNEIAGDEESYHISKILAKPEYIKHIVDENVFKHVQFRLWDNSQIGPGHKAYLTRKRNEYLKKSGKMS